MSGLLTFNITFCVFHVSVLWRKSILCFCLVGSIFFHCSIFLVVSYDCNPGHDSTEFHLCFPRQVEICILLVGRELNSRKLKQLCMWKVVNFPQFLSSHSVDTLFLIPLSFLCQSKLLTGATGTLESTAIISTKPVYLEKWQRKTVLLAPIPLSSMGRKWSLQFQFLCYQNCKYYLQYFHTSLWDTQ